MFLEHIELPEFLRRNEDQNRVVYVVGKYAACWYRLIDVYHIYCEKKDAEAVRQHYYSSDIHDMVADVCRFIDEHREAIEIASKDFAIVSMFEADFLGAIQAARAVPGKLAFDQKERLKGKTS